MRDMSFVEKILSIRERMQDDESRFIFDARIDLMLHGDKDKFAEQMYSLRNGYACPEVESRLSEVNAKGIILFGCGKDGFKTKRLLEDSGYSVDFFCDSAPEKTGNMRGGGMRVISVDELVENYRDHLVILSSRKYRGEMREMLAERKFPEEMIMDPCLGIVCGVCGWQYFDVLSPCENEVFIDGGSWNGDTIHEFIKYSKGNYKKIWVFEPLHEMYQFIQDRVINEKWENVEVINGALWNRCEQLVFMEDTIGSRVADTGERTVCGMDIDSVAGDEKVTFIKLDVETAELKALEGAKKIIQRDKPKLAVSVYHKPADIIDLPMFIINLLPDCRFTLRHYSTGHWETVLYAEFG